MKKSSIRKVLIIFLEHLCVDIDNFILVTTKPAVPVAKFAASFVDTGGYTGVVDTGGAPSLANISANFRTCGKKSRDTVPLMPQVALVFYGKTKPFCSGTIISSRNIFYNK
jgi:hypothetical protein